MTMQPTPRAVAIYARVSTGDQHADNQLTELRAYVAARGWTAAEYIDNGISGAKASRPALDRMMQDAHRRRFQAVCCWSLDRFGRSLSHVVSAITDLHERGIAFVSLREGLDFSTAAGRFQLAVMAALGEFERARLIERTHAGLDRARREGKTLGRPRRDLTAAETERTAALTVREAARQLRTSPAAVIRARRAFLKTPTADQDFRPSDCSEIGATV